MPSSRSQPSLSQTRNSTIWVRARVYSSDKARPSWKAVPTSVSPKRGRRGRRYPWVESLFDHRYIQPHLHDAKITVHQNGKKYNFIVFCQNHCHLPLNAAVAGHWRGDIVAMRIGAEQNDYINMPSQDAQRIDEAINKFVIGHLLSEAQF
ncbi:hypothetical protein BJ912DRAFT_936878 [Pholiota molesta]|nr:hypothetical protein BJ912DRAFT_936878 [Pholiota molesta]